MAVSDDVAPALREISLLQLAEICWRHKLGIAAGMLISGAIGFASSYLVTPLYRASVVVMPSAQDEGVSLLGLAGRFGSLASAAGVDIQPQGLRAEALEYLSSRAFAREFLEREAGLTALFPERWSASTKKWKDGLEPTPNEAFRRFDKNVRSVFPNRKSGALSISMTLANRETAAEWANDVVTQLNEKMRDRAIEESRKSIRFLQQELANTQHVDVRLAIGRLLESQFKTIMLANVREQYALRVIDPAVVPDRDEPVRPFRAVYAIAAATVGGFSLALLFVTRASRQESTRTP